MSRAFVKEDVDPPERKRRPRSAFGLPPGALNYLTTLGAAQLRRELDDARCASPTDTARIAELEHILASATIVEVITNSTSGVAFGTAVTLRDSAGELRTYRVVGVNELHFYENAVAWISPLGRALLAAELNGKVVFEEGELGRVVKIENASPVAP
jgi:transcription elongation GreA/GreB family factor